MRVSRRPEAWVFVILLGSYAFFWHSRDWNSASRLMLTYALVDRGTITLDGLDDQTGDKARFRGHYYTDKLPGYSLLATGPYALAKAVWRLPDHPLNREGFAYWPADYWTTLGTSGLLTALTGVVLVGLARELGCGPRRSALVGLAYGLATPAYAYATMSYGHQASAFALLLSFALLWRPEAPRGSLRMVLAGFLAAYAAVIELQVGPVSAILGVYLLAQVAGGRRRIAGLGEFAVGAIVPTLVLLGYNLLAFGSPWDMGYFHHATAMFAQVHNAGNPLGLGAPDWTRARDLLWGGHRGLLFYAPIVALAVPGWVVLVVPTPLGDGLGLGLGGRGRLPGQPELSGVDRRLVDRPPVPGPAPALRDAPGRRLAGRRRAMGHARGGPPDPGRGRPDAALPGGRGAHPQSDRRPAARRRPPPLARRSAPRLGHRGTVHSQRRRPALPRVLDRLPPGRLWMQFLPLVAAQALAIAAMVLSLGRDVLAEDRPEREIAPS